MEKRQKTDAEMSRRRPRRRRAGIGPAWAAGLTILALAVTVGPAVNILLTTPSSPQSGGVISREEWRQRRRCRVARQQLRAVQKELRVLDQTIAHKYAQAHSEWRSEIDQAERLLAHALKQNKASLSELHVRQGVDAHSSARAKFLSAQALHRAWAITQKAHRDLGEWLTGCDGKMILLRVEEWLRTQPSRRRRSPVPSVFLSSLDDAAAETRRTRSAKHVERELARLAAFMPNAEDSRTSTTGAKSITATETEP